MFELFNKIFDEFDVILDEINDGVNDLSYLIQFKSPPVHLIVIL